MSQRFETCGRLRVACVGDSLTRGDATHETWRKKPPPNVDRGNYPAHLQRLLGSGFIVRNFGHGGTTACNASAAPYARTREYQRAVDFKPHLLVLMLGTNDAKDTHWGQQCDGSTLIDGLASIVTALGRPPTLLLAPPPIMREKWNIRKHLLVHARHAVTGYFNRSLTASASRRSGGWLCDDGSRALTTSRTLRGLARPFVDEARLRRYFTNDGVHLNVAGSRRLACDVLSAISEGIRAFHHVDVKDRPCGTQGHDLCAASLVVLRSQTSRRRQKCEAAYGAAPRRF